MAPHLLRRHVTHRPEQHAGLSANGLGRKAGSAGARRRHVGSELGQAEIEDLHAPVGGDEQVLRLQVAMHDALFVRTRQAVSNLDRVIDGLADRESSGRARRTTRSRPSREPLAQRLSFEQLRDDVGRPVVRADVVDREDVGMVQRGGRPCLLFKAAKAIGVGRESSGQHFDGHIARETGIARPIDLAHPAGAERSQDLVGAKLRTRGDAHGATSREVVEGPSPAAATPSRSPSVRGMGAESGRII